MSKVITVPVTAFTSLEQAVSKINEAVADKNVQGIFYNKSSLMKGEIEILVSAPVVIEKPVKEYVEVEKERIVKVPVIRNPHLEGKVKSNYTGVHRERPSHRWRASITANGKRVSLGRFDNEEDAARAYDIAAKKLHGRRATLNFKEVE